MIFADDNQDAVITMGWILEAKGCQVQVVEDGSSALKAVASFTPDLVLLDIGMPGMNGYELCTALRQNRALPYGTMRQRALKLYWLPAINLRWCYW
ncbi:MULTISPECIES: response regulator [Alteromonas]|uniref:response regulator n=1 Tax=Alteromonas TaxID=226 RepID=UPI001EF21C46|nr:response regulator [Alteromonas sp. MmMcT2-2]MCG7651239.1 response regulator [Alteromonas sp. MmMcT2-5]MEC8903938.1 response regulator [Pseudomonadota bacterium]MED5333244.1 response regulator [Pseudomonadota bacterium]MED5490315.1 response regulator [Pseudomonadota bacterium]